MKKLLLILFAFVFIGANAQVIRPNRSGSGGTFDTTKCYTNVKFDSITSCLDTLYLQSKIKTAFTIKSGSDTIGNVYPVLKRNTTPTANGLFYWNSNSKRAITSSNLTFDGNFLSSKLSVWSDTLFLQKYTWHTSSSSQGISNQDSTFVYYYKYGNSALANKIANSSGGHLICWYNSTTLKKGFISYAVTASDTVKFVIYGARYVAGDKTFRISTTEKIQTWEYFIPGELLADSLSDIGMEHVKRYGDSLTLIGLSAYLKVAAVGSGASLKFGVYSNTYNSAMSYATKITSASNAYTAFGTGSLLNNIITTQPTITGRNRVTIRIIESAGATNKANGINIMLYYCQKDLFDSL